MQRIGCLTNGTNFGDGRYAEAETQPGPFRSGGNTHRTMKHGGTLTRVLNPSRHSALQQADL